MYMYFFKTSFATKHFQQNYLTVGYFLFFYKGSFSCLAENEAKIQHTSRYLMVDANDATAFVKSSSAEKVDKMKSKYSVMLDSK